MTTSQLLTDSDVADLLRISTVRVKRLVKDGTLPHVALPGGEVRFIEQDMVDWINSQRQPVAEAAAS